MKQVLSVGQMKHLQKIGFDTSDGSMCFEWSESDPDKEVLTIQKLADSYTCLYMEFYTRSMIKITESKELIDAAYEMLCWCIENGYVKVGKEE